MLWSILTSFYSQYVGATGGGNVGCTQIPTSKVLGKIVLHSASVPVRAAGVTHGSVLSKIGVREESKENNQCKGV